MRKNSGSQEALVKEEQVNSKFLVHTHPEMQQLGFEHLQEVLGVEPDSMCIPLQLDYLAFSLQSMYVMGDLLNCVDRSLDLSREM